MSGLDSTLSNGSLNMHCTCLSLQLGRWRETLGTSFQSIFLSVVCSSAWIWEGFIWKPRTTISLNLQRDFLNFWRLLLLLQEKEQGPGTWQFCCVLLKPCTLPPHPRPALGNPEACHHRFVLCFFKNTASGCPFKKWNPLTVSLSCQYFKRLLVASVNISIHPIYIPCVWHRFLLLSY